MSQEPPNGPISTRTEIHRASIPVRASVEPRADQVPGFVLPADEYGANLSRTLGAVFAAIGRVEKGTIAAQVDAQGIGSLGFVTLVLAFVGAILVDQAGVQALRVVPDTSTIGCTYLEMLVRDLAATLTALMLAAKVGAGIAAEIGSMKVTEQLDALRLSNADPVITIVTPRVLASVFYTPLLTIVGGAAATASGTLTGLLLFDINPTVFLDGRFIDLSDWVSGFLKSLAFGLAIPLASAHAGLYAKGGSQGVGDATTRAVVTSSLAVIMIGFIIGAVTEVLAGS